MKSRELDPANQMAAVSYKKNNTASRANWNVENVAMNNITHTYPANAATIAQNVPQPQAGPSYMFNHPQCGSQQMYAPENNAAYYYDQGPSTQHYYTNQYVHQVNNYTMYNAQPQYESQIQHLPAENANYVQRDPYMDLERNMYGHHYNSGNNVQEQPMPTPDVNNYTYANASYVPNSEAENTTLEEVIRSSLSDLTDLLDL